LGMGWVSLFDPVKLAQLLNMPTDAKPIAVLCLGHVNSFYKEPMLVEAGWAVERPLSDMLMENGWQNESQNECQNSHQNHSANHVKQA